MVLSLIGPTVFFQMLIEVKKDVLDKAHEHRNEKFNEAAELLRDLAIAVLRQKHIVYIPELQNNETKKKIKEVLNEADVKLLSISLSKRLELGRIIDVVRKKMVVTYDSTNINPDDNIIVLIPGKYPKFECFKETHIIAENIADIKLYEKMVTLFCKNNQINSHTLCYYPLMGGGATTAKVVLSAIKLSQHLSFIVCDSDKRFPGDTKDGDTYKKIKEVVDKENSDICELYVMKNVAEIENLIPHRFLKEHCQYTTACEDVFKSCPEFYDIKKGYTIGSLYDDEVASFWKSKFPNIDFSHRDQIKTQYPCKRDYDAEAKKSDKNKVIEMCWGNSVLTEILEKADFSQITKDDLTEEQFKEWMQIGCLLFSWACCMGNERFV